MVVCVAADVAGAAGTRAHAVQRLFHCGYDRRMLAHAEIIVGAPDGDWLGPVAAEAMRVGKAAFGAQDVDEDAIAAFFVQPVDGRSEDAVVVQRLPSLGAPLASAKGQFHCERLAIGQRTTNSSSPKRASALSSGRRTGLVKTPMPGGRIRGHGCSRVR